MAFVNTASLSLTTRTQSPVTTAPRSHSNAPSGYRRRAATLMMSQSVDAQAEVVARIQRALPEFDEAAIVDALAESSGDEMAALTALTGSSSVARDREELVEKYRQQGVNRMSALEEAAFRRKATGSASDFFKDHIEVQGSYVDAGYVDEGADFMGDFMAKVKKLFNRD